MIGIGLLFRDSHACSRTSCRCSGSCAKIGVILFLFIWVRGTLPRFRYDQLMSFAWKFMFPVALVNLLITALRSR